MTWQEELRRLDVQLADGVITQEEHRRRREDVLAEASGGPVASPVAAPLGRVGAAPERRWQAANPASPGNHPGNGQGRDHGEPPATDHESGSHGGTGHGSSEAGNRLAKPDAAALLETDRPTTAPSPADVRRTESMPYPVVGAPAPRGSELTMPMAKVPATTAPPRPTRPVVSPAAGPDQTKRRRTGLTWLVICLGLVVALGAVLGGARWLGGMDPGPSRGHAMPQPTTTPPASTDTDNGVDLERRLPALPGTPSPHNGTMTVQEGLDLGLYPPEGADMFAHHGVNEVTVWGSADGYVGYVVLVIPTQNPAAARDMVSTWYRGTLAGGFTPGPTDVLTATGIDGDVRMLAGWYTSAENAVSIGLSQPAAQSDADLSRRLNDVIRSLQTVLPSD